MGKKKGYNVAEADGNPIGGNSQKVAFTQKDYDEILNEIEKPTSEKPLVTPLNSNQEKEDAKFVQKNNSKDSKTDKIQEERTNIPKYSTDDEISSNSMERSLKSPSKARKEEEVKEMTIDSPKALKFFGAVPPKEKIAIQSENNGQDQTAVTEHLIVKKTENYISKETKQEEQDDCTLEEPLKSSPKVAQEVDEKIVDCPKAMKFFGAVPPKEKIATQSENTAQKQSASENAGKETEDYISIDLEGTKQAKQDDFTVKKPGTNNWYKKNLLIVVSSCIILIILIIVIAATQSKAHSQKRDALNGTQSNHQDEIMEPRKGLKDFSPAPFSDEDRNEETPQTQNRATSTSMKEDIEQSTTTSNINIMTEHLQTFPTTDTIDFDHLGSNSSVLDDTTTPLFPSSTSINDKEKPPGVHGDDYDYEGSSGSGFSFLGDLFDETFPILTNASDPFSETKSDEEITSIHHT